jgi:hypothetical protein
VTIRSPAGGRAAAVCALAAACAYAPDARAELRESVERLADAWRAVGASVVIDRTRFLDDSSDDRRPVVVVLPQLPEGDCTTVVMMGARGLGFHVRLAGASTDEPENKRIPSIAGAISIERCGESIPRRLVVASDSGRGAFETVVARSSRALPSLRTVLPERSGGTLLPMSEPGPLPALPSPEKRAEVSEIRAKRDGASIGQRSTWEAGVDGAGTGQEQLEPGCHTLQLFAQDPRAAAARSGRRGKLDLDAEMRDASDDRLLARDRTDAPDAQLAACIGEPTRVNVVFAGSPPGAPVLVSHARWPLPDHLPALWGSETRARMARVLLVRHVSSLPRDPVQLAQGGFGLTSIPLSIEPGGCYLAVVALARESARAIGLRVRVGVLDAGDARGIDEDGAAVAFCAGARTHALAEVEARGTPLLGWGLALYHLQSGIWEAPQ